MMSWTSPGGRSAESKRPPSKITTRLSFGAGAPRVSLASSKRQSQRGTCVRLRLSALRPCRRTSMAIGFEWEHGNDRIGVEGPVDMREYARARPLVSDLGPDLSRVDAEKHKIPFPAVESLGDGSQLVWIGTVYEPIFLLGLRRVRPGKSCLIPPCALSDVQDQAQPGPA